MVHVATVKDEAVVKCHDHEGFLFHICSQVCAVAMW